MCDLKVRGVQLEEGKYLDSLISAIKLVIFHMPCPLDAPSAPLLLPSPPVSSLAPSTAGGRKHAKPPY
jgi:hypothetical protein